MPAKSLNLDTDVLVWLDEAAADEGKSASAIVNEALRGYMEAESQEKASKRRRA